MDVSKLNAWKFKFPVIFKKAFAVGAEYCTLATCEAYIP